MPDYFSRREALGVLSAVSLGPGALAARSAAAAAPVQPPPDAGAGVYNIREFGARGDGTTLDTGALQAAIDACHRDGGGTVLVPAGVFQIGTVEIKSNVTLHLAAAATLLGSADGTQYHAVDAIPLRGDATLGDGNWALLFAVNASNVAIEGAGLIDGQGIQFHAPASGVPPPSGLGGSRRPYHLLCYRCEHLRLEHVRLRNSAFHSVRVIQSRDIVIDGLHIFNRVNNNNDGFHFISCEHVRVANCTVLCQDDACALFGSCRSVTVTNSTFSTRWSVFRFGGGTAENVTVSNCVLDQVYGCPFKFQGRPGSRFENMSFANLLLKDVTGPISISVGPPENQTPGAAPAGPPGVVRNISFSNIHGTVIGEPPPLADYPFTSPYRPGEIRSCIVLNAVGDSIVEQIAFDNVHLTFEGGGTADQAARRDLPEVAGEYFVLGPLPAYALYARNARGVTLQNVRFQVAKPDLRPAIVFDGVQDAAISGLGAQGNPDAESVLRFVGCRDALVTAPRVLTPAAAFLRLEGAANRGIIVDGGDLSKVARPVVYANGATAAAITVRGQ